MTLIDQAGRARTTTRYVAPPEGLGEVVVGGWIQRYSDAVRSETRAWRVVPDAQPHLIVHRSVGGGTRGPRVVGARSTWLDVRVAERAWSAGVTLRPGALPALTGLPAHDLMDRSAPAEDVWGPTGALLREVSAEADSGEGVIRVLFAFLRERLPASGAAVDWRVRGFRVLAGRESRPAVGELAAELGVSPRTLRDVWWREVGLSPKETLSVARVHRAVGEAVEGRRGRSWAGLAAAAGFYDQAHLIRDFRRLLGEPPGRFLARGAPGG